MAGLASRLGPIGSVMMALGPAGLAAGAAIGFFGKAMVESTIKAESLEARLKGLVGAAALTETTSYLYTFQNTHDDVAHFRTKVFIIASLRAQIGH